MTLVAYANKALGLPQHLHTRAGHVSVYASQVSGQWMGARLVILNASEGTHKFPQSGVERSNDQKER